MTISAQTKKLLYKRSGNRCAFPNCGKELARIDSANDSVVDTSDIAHIVAQKADGPRGTYYSGNEDRDAYENLILLCQEHHRDIDSNAEQYTVEQIRHWKVDHERKISEAAGAATEPVVTPSTKYVRDGIVSNILPILTHPQFVYGIRGAAKPRAIAEISKTLSANNPGGFLTPFLLHEDSLYSFSNPSKPESPFNTLLGSNPLECSEVRGWWSDPDRIRLYVALLNRALTGLLIQKGMVYDNNHGRHYFTIDDKDSFREVTYVPMNGKRSKRNVVWQPTRRSTGEKRPYWHHLALRSNFLRFSGRDWVLVLRPELHLTSDRKTPYYPEFVGRRITRVKSKEYNYDVLGDTHFWRSYLCEKSPRIILRFSESSMLILSSDLLSGEIEWPGLPAANARRFSNTSYEEDLLSLATLKEAELSPEDLAEPEW